MATYSQHPTVNTGDLWSATDQNTYVKANFDFIGETRSFWLPIETGAKLESMEKPLLSTFESTGASPKVTRFIQDFSPSTDNALEFRNYIAPPDYIGSAVLNVYGHMDGVESTAAVEVNVQVAAISVTDRTVEGKVYDVVNTLSQAVPDAQNEQFMISIALANDDSMVTGDSVNFAVWVDVSDSSITTNLRVTGIEVEYGFT